jgi:hypothetical protein
MWGPISVDCCYCFKTFWGWSAMGVVQKIRRHWRKGCDDDPVGQWLRDSRKRLNQSRPAAEPPGLNKRERP